MTSSRRTRLWLASLLAWALSPAPLPAAIVQTGNVSPNVSTWTSITTGYIGQTSDGSVTVDAGSLLASGNVNLSPHSNSTGTATVTGAGSKWTNTSELTIGGRGVGSLNIEAGGEVSNAGGAIGHGPNSTGTARVTGDGSKWTIHRYDLTVGSFGNGMLAVEAGGLVISAQTRIGDDSGSTGTAVVTGAGSKWTNSSLLSIGYNGAGTLAIDAGGLVSTVSGRLGESSGSTGTATVSGAGSKWTNSSQLTIGGKGVGTLTIKAGGLVTASTSSNTSFLGYDSGSTGTATVTGAGSKWTNSGDLYVGHVGVGTLTVEAGGEVANTGGTIGFESRSTGTAMVTGANSKWTNRGGLNVNRGTLTIEDGGLVSVGEALAISSIWNSSINMTTGGMLALYGNADDSLSQFLGLVQGTDAIRFWDDSVSDWAPLASATFGEDYTLEYLSSGDLAGYTLLTVGDASSPVVAGDFNADGSVDGTDFLTWQRGESPDPLGEGSLTAWKTHFGTSASGAGSGIAAEASATVPEPTASALALLLPLVGRQRHAAKEKQRRLAAAS